MRSESSSGTSRPNLSDVIMTLPLPAVVAMTLLLVGGLAASVWAALSGNEHLRDLAKQLVVVELPLLVAVIAAIGIRRSSSHEIDRLVSRFLDVVIRERLAIACRDHADGRYPFKSVKLNQPSRGRSYAYYTLDWASLPHAPVQVGVKMNIFNIEVLADLPLRLPAAAAPARPVETFLVDRASLGKIADHTLLQSFQGVIQGSVEEGYAVRLTLRHGADGRADLHVSLRQKLADNILSSPYLKRYFAEDIAIVVGVLFDEWHQSGLALDSTEPVGKRW